MMRLILLSLFSLYLFCCHGGSDSKKPQENQQPPGNPPPISPQAKDDCARAVGLATEEASRKLRCQLGTHSTNRACAYVQGQCIPATSCGQLDMATQCNNDSIAGMLCSYDVSDPKKTCTERYVCENIADLSLCDGKRTLDSGSLCRVLPIAGHNQCVPVNTASFRKLWNMRAGPGALVVEASYFAVKKQEHILTFGANTGGRLLIPADIKEVQAVGNNYACGLTKTDTTLCWGDNSSGQATPPLGLIFKKIDAKDNFACGLVRDGINKNKIACWGNLPAGIASKVDNGFIKLSYNYVGGLLGNKLTEATEFMDFATTDNQLCASVDTLEDPYQIMSKNKGYLFCSGDWQYQPLEFSFSPGFYDVTSGPNKFCARGIGIIRQALCWYDNHNAPIDNMRKGVFFKTGVGKPKKSVDNYDNMAVADNLGCFFTESPTDSSKGKISCFDEAGAPLAAINNTLSDVYRSFTAGPDFSCAVDVASDKLLCFGSGAQAILNSVPTFLK
jgi:hypothetical protein